jgi:hypothetical protein
MAGLVPAIHVFNLKKEDVDARDKRGHDGSAWFRALFSSNCTAIDVIR